MIWVILILAFALRIINLNQSLWLDEATQAILSSKSLFSIWFERAADFHPPLSYIFYHFWIQLGTSEIWLRLLSVIFGVLTVWLVYLLATRLFSKKIGLLSAFLLALAPYHIYYSQEVRMYSLAAFLATAAIFFYIKPVRNNLYNNLGFIISAVALIYTHYLGFFLLFSLVIYSLKTRAVNYKNFLVIALLWLPWFPQFLKQLQSGVSAEQYLPGWSNLLSLNPLKAIPLTFLKFSIGRIDFESVIFYAIVAIITLSLVGFLLIVGAINLKKDQRIIVFWLILPIILAFLISFKIPLNQPFRLLFVLPAFYILIAIGILSFGKHWKLALMAVVLVSLSGLYIYYSSISFWREDWRGATNFVNPRISERSAVLFTWSEPFSPYLWYQGKNGVGFIRKFPATKEEISSNIKLESKSEVYLFEYLQILSDPNKHTQKILEENKFTLAKTYDFRGVGFIDYYTR